MNVNPVEFNSIHEDNDFSKIKADVCMPSLIKIQIRVKSFKIQLKVHLHTLKTKWLNSSKQNHESRLERIMHNEI